MAAASGGRELFGDFRGTTAHYLAARPPDAGLLIRRVAELVGLTRRRAVPDHRGRGPIAPDRRRSATIVSAALIGRRTGQETLP